jgi:hypothetical protein
VALTAAAAAVLGHPSPSADTSTRASEVTPSSVSTPTVTRLAEPQSTTWVVIDQAASVAGGDGRPGRLLGDLQADLLRRVHQADGSLGGTGSEGGYGQGCRRHQGA